MERDLEREWLEADGLGGFASGTVGGWRTRRYHAMLLAATTPPTGRQVLVSGFEARIAVAGASGELALFPQVYAPDVVHPPVTATLVAFTAEPWPTWTWELDGGRRLRQELFVAHGSPLTAIRWTPVGDWPAAELRVRLFVAARDYHALRRESDDVHLEPLDVSAGRFRLTPDAAASSIAGDHNGTFAVEPLWYRRFLYRRERERGLDHMEDLAAPGVLAFDLRAGPAVLLLAAGAHAVLPSEDATGAWERLAAREASRRAAFGDGLVRAADAYVVRRGRGLTIVAGYPWFTDWGRDTFIAMRGLLIATGRLDDARAVLLAWADTVSEGMLPNRFPDRGAAPDYNAVDASLWYVIAVHDYLAARQAVGSAVDGEEEAALRGAVGAILDGYTAGTRHGIAADEDGLLRAGEPDVQLTWMDAKVDGRVITPRTGKPVEVQALWLNALEIAGSWDERYRAAAARGRGAFEGRFWCEETGALADVVDVDHVSGAIDRSFRPNQLFAAGGLPHVLVAGPRARRIVDRCVERLWTPFGVRTLAPGEPGYRATYDGGPVSRDEAYHQGTVWPWLAGPLVEAWVRVRGGGAAVRAKARERFFAPLRERVGTTGVGHLPEIADAEAPWTARGAPFQAWSLGELIRLDRTVL